MSLTKPTVSAYFATAFIFLLSAFIFAGIASAQALNVGDLKEGYTVAAIIISQIFGAGAAYAAIKGDITRAHDKATAAHDTAKSAHQRIDDVYERLGDDRRRR